MAKFHKGSWRGTHYKTVPIGIRKHFGFAGLTFPYVSGDKIRFRIEIIKREIESSPRLNQLDIWEVFISHFGDEKRRKIETLSSYPGDARAGSLFDEAYITSNHAEYWLGEPKGVDSHLLVEADLLGTGEFYMKFIFPAFTAFAGFVLNSLIAWAIYFLK